MTVVMRCDWCGEEIPTQAPMITVNATASANADQTSGWFGHYHAGIWRDDQDQMVGRHCFRRMSDAVQMVHEYAPAALESTPVATPQKIAQLRRKHRTTSDRDAV